MSDFVASDSREGPSSHRQYFPPYRNIFMLRLSFTWSSFLPRNSADEDGDDDDREDNHNREEKKAKLKGKQAIELYAGAEVISTVNNDDDGDEDDDDVEREKANKQSSSM